LDIHNSDNQYILRCIGFREPNWKEFLCKVAEHLDRLPQAVCVKWLEAITTLSNNESPWAAKHNQHNAIILNAIEKKKIVVFDDGTRACISAVLDPTDQVLASIFSGNNLVIFQIFTYLRRNLNVNFSN
jgi:hypothetical protein